MPRPLRRALGASGLLLLALGAPGCTVFTDYNETTAEARGAFVAGDFDRALAAYEEHLEDANDGLLYHLEGGLVAHVGGRWDRSIALLKVAYDRIDRYQDGALQGAGDVARAVGSVLVNEKTLPYVGETFEQVLLQGYQARNRFLAGQRDAVLPEVLRTYDIQRRAREIFEAELEATERAARDEGDQVDQDGVVREMRRTYDYGDLTGAESVFEIRWLRYLDAWLREATSTRQEDYNAAWIDLQFVADVFGHVPFVQRDLVRMQAASGDGAGAREAAQRFGLRPLPRDAGSVAVFFECGLAPRKRQVKVLLPTYRGVAAIAMPRYEAVPNPATGVVLELGGERAQTVVLSDVEAIAFRYHRDRLPLLIAKQIIRLAVKVAIQVGGDAALRNNAGRDGWLAGAAFSVGMSIWNVVSEQADLRAWRTLPQTLQATRVYVPAGTYPARLVLVGRGGGKLAEVDLGTITVAAGKHRMINARSLGARLFAQVPAEPYDGRGAPAGAAREDLRRPDAQGPGGARGPGEARTPPAEAPPAEAPPAPETTDHPGPQ